MLLRYLTVEILKLRRSLALLLCIAAPSCIVLLQTLILLDRGKPMGWPSFSMSGVALWSFAMLPLTVTALSVLMAQMEHGPKTWDHLLALPGARRWAFLAKALVTIGLVGGMCALLWVLLQGAGRFLNLVHPGLLTGSADPAGLARTLILMFVAALLVTMLQLWVALRFRSFVVPLVFGIAGTLVAIGATSARQGIYFPWLLATNMLSTPDRQQTALLLGGLGGLIALAAMAIHLAHREA